MMNAVEADSVVADINGDVVTESIHSPPQVHSKRFYQWRWTVVFTLLIGYAAYYFNRSNLSVTTNSIIDDVGLNKTEFGVITTTGYAVYAAGKVVNGIAIDYIGGRVSFLLGLGVSAVFTVAFTFCKDIPGFTITWSINRFFQSIGWGALVKVTSHWFSDQEYGRVMGMMSLSYMMGDALIRLLLGTMLNLGLTWQEIFYFCAALAVFVIIPSLWTLKESPLSIGEREPRASLKSVYETSPDLDGTEKQLSLWQLLKPLLLSPKFYILLILSTVLTLIRETFNSWTPVYLDESLGLSEGDAAIASMVFPAAGTLSALIGGYLVDRVPARYRGGVSLIFLLGLSGALIGLSRFANYYDPTQDGATAIALTLIGIVGLFLIAPYSFLDGVFTLELAGKQGCAATASIVNGAGYIGATLSGVVTGLVADNGGWGKVFVIMTGLSLLSLLGASIYWFLDIQDIRKAQRKAGYEPINSS